MRNGITDCPCALCVVQVRWLDFKVRGPFAAESKHALVDAMGHVDAAVWWNRGFQSLAVWFGTSEQSHSFIFVYIFSVRTLKYLGVYEPIPSVSNSYLHSDFGTS